MTTLVEKYVDAFKSVTAEAGEAIQVEAYIDTLCGYIRFNERCSREEIEDIKKALTQVADQVIKTKFPNYNREMKKRRVLILGPKREVPNNCVIETDDNIVQWEMTYDDAKTTFGRAKSYNKDLIKKFENSTSVHRANKTEPDVLRIWQII